MRFNPTMENFNAIHQTLLDDVLSVFSKPRERLDLGRIQQIRRAYLRAVFVFIEALIFQIKQLALTRGKTNGLSFSSCELSLLQEEEYNLNEKGVPQSRVARLKLVNNFKFANNVFCKAHNCNYCPNYENHKWRSFQRAQKIRNRVTHPKAAADLEISDDEVKEIDEAVEWVRDWHLKLFESAGLISNRPRKHQSKKHIKDAPAGGSKYG